MIGDHLMPHRVSPVTSVDSTDAYGNPVRVPGTPGEPVPAYVQPVETNEDSTEGQVRESRYRVYVNPDLVELDAWSEIVWENRRYELLGDPRRYDTPAGAHHLVLVVRKVGA